jgi:hypothetical protein
MSENEIVRVTKLYSFLRNFVTLKHMKMSHRCLHRRFSRAAAIESNESRPLLAFKLVDLSRTAIEQLAESKTENVYIVACHFDSIQQKLRRTSW